MKHRHLVTASVLSLATVFFAPVAEADPAGASATRETGITPAAESTPAASTTPEAAITPATESTPASITAPQPVPRQPSGPKRQSRFDYSLSAAVGFPLGNLGYNITANQGIIQGGVGYQIDPLTKVEAYGYQIPGALIGVNGAVPLFIRGDPKPVGTVKLPPINPSVIYKLAVVTVQRTVFLDHHLIIITPGYISTFSEFSDSLLIENRSLGIEETARLRSFQQKFIAVSVPIVLRRQFIAVATASSQWLIATHSVNETNHARLNLLGYAEYFANQHTSFFVQPSRFVSYVPSDPYPQYSFTLTYGLNFRLTKFLWAQAQVFSITPTNFPRNGIVALTCATASCRSVAPDLGSAKAANFQLSVGIGKPIVVPI